MTHNITMSSDYEMRQLLNRVSELERLVEQLTDKTKENYIRQKEQIAELKSEMPNTSDIISKLDQHTGELEDILRWTSNHDKDHETLESWAAGIQASVDNATGYKEEQHQEESSSNDVQKAADTLGVSPDDDISTIKTAYRTLCMNLHPDRNKNTDPEKIKAVNAAYEILEKYKKKAA